MNNQPNQEEAAMSDPRVKADECIVTRQPKEIQREFNKLSSIAIDNNPWARAFRCAEQVFTASEKPITLKAESELEPDWEIVGRFYFELINLGYVHGQTEKDATKYIWHWGLDSSERIASACNAMTKRFCPKDILGWDETGVIHEIISRSGFWGSFF